MASGENAVQIKICGLTRDEDVETCETLGIDWAGFNFWPRSKRYIPPASAKALIARLKRTQPVGVFVNPTREEVEEAVALSGIRYAQLHGEESWSLITSLPVPVIKALPADRLHDLQGLAEPLSRDPLSSEPLSPKPGRIAYLLIDTPAGSAYGGTGLTFDWSHLVRTKLPLPFFLAGGLGPENVAAAVAAVHPMAVDLNSKVETAPGIKNRNLIETCMRHLGRLATH